jgi:enoyl-CoA hydratase/carnithine racemase
MAADLLVDDQGPLLSVQISRPPGNLFTLEMCLDLTKMLQDPPAQARVLRLSAAGASFCLGRERTARTTADIYAMTHALAELNAALVESSLAVVAEVGGDAAGFGVGLAALADVAIAATGARFSFPEAEAGLAPALVLAWLPSVVGRRRAFWLTSSGQAIDAADAQRSGLINQVVPGKQLSGAAREVVDLLLRLPASVCAEIKRDLTSFSGLGIGAASERAVDRLALRSVLLNGQQQAER